MQFTKIKIQYFEILSLEFIQHMYYRILIFALLLWLSLSSHKAPRFTDNYNPSNVNDYALISSVLDVQNNNYKNMERTHSAVNQKYNLQKSQEVYPTISYPGLQDKMMAIDYLIVFDPSPQDIFVKKSAQVYHPLEILQFQVIIDNKSQLFNICINSIFSDCQGIKKALKRPLPICINSSTKYPINFNLYVSSAEKYKDILTAGIYFNVTIFYQQTKLVVNKLWLYDIGFQVVPNHLKLNAFQIRNCEQQNSAVTIKNYQKHDLIFLINHKYKKFYLNGQPLDDKFTVNSQKTFKFMLQSKDSTIVIHTKAVEPIDKIYPVLYVPVYCYDKLYIDNVQVGLISQFNYAFSYHLVVSSYSNSIILIQDIILSSTSGAVQLTHRQNCKNTLQPLEKFIIIAYYIVRASKNPSFKNSITFKIKYSLSNSRNPSQIYQAQKTIVYTQNYNSIILGKNRYMDLTTLKDYKQYTEQQKYQLNNFTIYNMAAIPIKVSKIYNPLKDFDMYYTEQARLYIGSNDKISQIFMHYKGPKTIPMSPVRYLAAFQFAGDIFYPFQIVVYDKTLSCVYQNKQSSCSNLKYINFGYHKSDEKVQSQTITFKNFNPIDIFVFFELIKPDQRYRNIIIDTKFNDIFPPTNEITIITEQNGIQVKLLANHYINVTFQIKVKGNIIYGEIPLSIRTQFQLITPIIKFNFEQGKFMMLPSSTYRLSNFQSIQHSSISFFSTYQQKYKIKQIISDSNALLFHYNDSQQYENNETVTINYTYNPYTSDNNITSQCCNDFFLQNHYVNSLIKLEESQDETHHVTLITNNDIQIKFKINIGSQHEYLIEQALQNKTIHLPKLKIGKHINFCLKMKNPYPFALKYNVFIISNEFLYKPKDFLIYFNHAKKQKTQAYFCYTSNRFGISAPNIIKQLFRLEQKPHVLDIDIDSKKIIGSQGSNLSYNDYISSIYKTGSEVCYKLTTLIYFKLLIQSQILNYLLDHYHYDTVALFLDKEWQFLRNFTFSYTYDPFYNDLKINFKKYCDYSVFPIFKFCLNHEITLNKQNLKPLFSNRKENRNFGYSLQPLETEKLCLKSGIKADNFKFEMVIANNFSIYDVYNINVEPIQPKISIGDIAFDLNNGINHNIFMKHYFSTLSKATNQELLAQGIQNIQQIVPIYLTLQDFDDQFKLFRGQRYFQIQNHVQLDIQFTHYGFEDQQNIKEWFGLSISKLNNDNNNQSNITLHKKSKNIFLLKFNLRHNFELNLTNPLYHRKINFYLYYHNQYHIKLIFLIKIADNLIIKLKQLQPSKQNQFKYGYLIINLISITIITLIVLFFQKEEKDHKNKHQRAKLKHYLKGNSQHNGGNEVKDISMSKNNFNFTQLLGNKFEINDQKKYTPYYVISEEQLSFFKTLKITKEEKSISQSSEKQFGNRLSNQEYTEKTQEKSQSMDKSQAQQQILESSFESEQNSQLDSQFSDQQHSIDQSVLPDGISVCNEELQNIDDFSQEDFNFDFNRNIKLQRQKKQSKQDIVYYNVFSNHNPLEKYGKNKQDNPFPWISKNIEKPMKKRTKQKKKNE